MRYFILMKGVFLSIILICASYLLGYSQDSFLLPDEFFLSKGQVLNVRLYVGEDLKDNQKQKNQSSITKLWFLDGGKKNDIKASSSDSLMPLLSRKLDNNGLAMVIVTGTLNEIEVPRDKFIEYLSKQGLDKTIKLLDGQKKESYREKISYYSKTLLMVEKPGGGLNNEKLGLPLEIVLMQNPYKMIYGDDMTAVVLFKGKALVNSHVEVLTKALNGSIFTTNYRTDAEGKIYFKLNRAGIWMVRLVHLLPAKDQGIDFENFGSNYTFGFR